MTEVTIDLEKFPFVYWNRNRIAILKVLIERGQIDNVRTLALAAKLNYGSTYWIITEFEKKYGLVTRQGRIIKLVSNWEEKFKLGRQ